MVRTFYEDTGQMIKLGKPHLALMSCRNALEIIVKDCCKRIGIDTSGREMNLEEMIKILYESGAINGKLNELFHRTRMLCNKGAHADVAVTMSDAQEAYSYLTEIMGIVVSAQNDARLDSIRAAYNVPMKDPDYYSAARRYYGKWANCFDRASLMVIPEYVELLGRAVFGDVTAMLDLAAGFLSRDIIWNSNMLINTPSVFSRGQEFNQENAYDYRYYYWVLMAVKHAAYLLATGQEYPKKYMATAIWDAALFSYECAVSNEGTRFRVSGVDKYFDSSIGRYHYQATYSNQVEEMLEMFGYDPNNCSTLFIWTDLLEDSITLAKDIFGNDTDCSIVAPIHTEGKTNAYLKLRFLRYATLALCTSIGDDSLRISDNDASEINADYELFRQIAPDAVAERKNVRGGEALTWEMLRPYTVGAFCNIQFVYGINHGKATVIRLARPRSSNRILQAVFGL